MQEIARLIHTIEQLLPPTQQDQRRRRTQLRDIFLRWSPTSRDVALLLGVFRDLSWNIQALSSPCDLQPTRRER
jgi:tRNA C32,U32 (ribose-2'-O)-methylase TrmJ